MDCIGNLALSTIKWRKGLGLHRRVPLEDAALPSPKRLRAGRSKASPTGLSVSEPIEGRYVLLLPDRGRSVKRLHRPNLLGLDCMGIKEHQSFKISYEH
jgi:hypothetical protein